MQAVEWNTFFDAVAGAMRFRMDAVEMPQELRPIFVEDFPRQREGAGFDTTLDVILWSVDASGMAPTSNKGDRIPNGIQLRGVRPSPTKAGYVLETWGWWELITARFTVYAKSNARVNELTSWFHRTMMVSAFGYRLFQARGVSYFKFLERQRDELSTEYGQDLYRTHLLYQARLDLRDEYEAKVLESVALNLGMTAGGPVATFEVDSDGHRTAN